MKFVQKLSVVLYLLKCEFRKPVSMSMICRIWFTYRHIRCIKKAPFITIKLSGMDVLNLKCAREWFEPDQSFLQLFVICFLFSRFLLLQKPHFSKLKSLPVDWCLKGLSSFIRYIVVWKHRKGEGGRNEKCMSTLL